MNDFNFSPKKDDKNLKKEKICNNCLHFDKSLFNDNGQCICVISKYYSDTMNINNTCSYFHNK